MTINRTTGSQLLRAGAFKALFIQELGWNHCSLAVLPVMANGRQYPLEPVAEKHGLAVFVVRQNAIPDYQTRREIERQVAKSVHEHLIIFCDDRNSAQIWQWVKREVGRPIACREHPFERGQQGEALLQKLEHITFALEDEGKYGIGKVVGAVRQAFDVDRVTKRFYDRFQTEHKTFLSVIDGLNGISRDWYASLMLNRLMFVYFIQKKGFLDDDVNYLPNKLKEVQARRGKDKFQTFYHAFLLKLFHDGLAGKPPRSKEIETLIGRVPYLNGGLFDAHQLERDNPKIDIPDTAFERIFAFFDAYQWHLDDRPVRNDTEINPDVLGYIFEKYINQKQMGAYYTKEDITEYISKSTIIPYLLQRAEESCAGAFAGDAAVWSLLAKDPDRYLYASMKVGVTDANGVFVPESTLPDFVQRGMHDPKARMFDRRYNLGEAAFRTVTGEQGTLPTETWREYVERRHRCLDIREKLALGQVRSVEDLVTFNLDLRQFLQDVIDTCDQPDLLRAIWHSVVGGVSKNGVVRHGIAILDPTCGSGAFLFAALGILEPLYEACLDRMASFVDDARRRGHEIDCVDFKTVLDNVGRHPSRRYFIYKSIILHNLFGVDIMPEAVEICKLRLFLKLVSQADTEAQLEPLPDIDFNIRAGNTLIGYATEQQFDAANTLASDQVNRAKISASMVALADRAARFRDQQTAPTGLVTSGDKRTLQADLDKLRLDLDHYMAQEYGVEPSKKNAFAAWRLSHQPFHWVAEFHKVMQGGGFDIVIGNPPYIEMHKLDGYSLQDSHYSTLSCGNLYAPVLERGLGLVKRGGWYGQIVPLSCVATARMQPLRDVWRLCNTRSWLSHYSGDAHPSVLFEGVKFRLTIVIQQRETADSGIIATTKFQRWLPEARPALFSNIEYAVVPSALIRNGLIPKADGAGIECVSQLTRSNAVIGRFVVRDSAHVCFAHRIVAHYVKAFDFIPYFRSERDGQKRSEDYKPFPLSTANQMVAFAAVLNSSQFYFWFVAYSDVYHCGRELILDFPCDLSQVAAKRSLLEVTKSLMGAYRATAVRRAIPYKRTGLVEYDEFYPRLVKIQLDKLDVELARVMDISDVQLDYLINYDIKFRVGGGDEEQD